LIEISSLFVWLVLICCERKVLLAGCWFVLKEKYCWLVADKPSEQAADHETMWCSLTRAIGYMMCTEQHLTLDRAGMLQTQPQTHVLPHHCH
jgi:hypothetical protein